jgi:hypothetical protein
LTASRSKASGSNGLYLHARSHFITSARSACRGSPVSPGGPARP